MNEIFFTSDLHIGHDKEFLYAPRGFTSVDVHDAAIIANINETVHNGDKLFILGDIVMGTDESKWNLLRYLDCQDVHVIFGNHDSPKKLDFYEDCGFILHGFADELKVGKHVFYLCHYPTYCANEFDTYAKVKCLHGHTHSKDKWSAVPHAYNVALDAHHNHPVNIEDIRLDFIQHRMELERDKAADEAFAAEVYDKLQKSKENSI